MSQSGQPCFVIGPIGAEGSPTRARADKVLNDIVTPALSLVGYYPIRADRVAEPGIITEQIVGYLVHAPLVVADLSGGNPNVLYELAIRHMARKPVVSLIEAGERIPFDVAALRIIPVAFHDPGGCQAAREAITLQVEAIQRDTREAPTPVARALGPWVLATSVEAVPRDLLESMVSRYLDLRTVLSLRHQPLNDEAVLSQAAVAISKMGLVLELLAEAMRMAKPDESYEYHRNRWMVGHGIGTHEGGA
jgi:hypothetical protein